MRDVYPQRHGAFTERCAFRHTPAIHEMQTVDGSPRFWPRATWLALAVAVVAASASAQADFEQDEIFRRRTIEFPVSAAAMRTKARLTQGNDELRGSEALSCEPELSGSGPDSDPPPASA